MFIKLKTLKRLMDIMEELPHDEYLVQADVARLGNMTHDSIRRLVDVGLFPEPVLVGGRIKVFKAQGFIIHVQNKLAEMFNIPRGR